MRETQFIGQNKEKWARFESIQRKGGADPDELTGLFVDITDDLSYARGFYPNRSVRVYLNQLAQRSFHALYRNKRGGFRRVLHFWIEDLPRLLFAHRKELRLSFILFILAIFIGVLSSYFDPDFPRTILGDRYIEMTKANIAQGDPMAVYKSSRQFDMTLVITVNNLIVALRIFVMGALAAVGSIYMLLYNGIMVGTFQYFFIERGIYLDSFLTIWLHGTLEIGSAIIAGGAGLVMGKGLLFPGTYSRMQSFLLHARRGLRILLGTVPLFIMAGFIEGYFTRYTEAPYAVRLLLILASLAFLIGYFVWYPMRKGRTPAPPSPDEQLYPDPALPFTPGTVYNNGMLFSFSFLLYKRWFWLITRWAALGAVLMATVLVLTDASLAYRLAPDEGFFSGFINFPVIFNLSEAPWAAAVLLATVTALMAQVLLLFGKQQQSGPATLAAALRVAILPALLTTGIFFISGPLALLAMLSWLPLAMLWMAASSASSVNVWESLRAAIGMFAVRGGRVLGLYTILVFTCAIFFLLVNSPLNTFLIDLVSWNILMDGDQYSNLVHWLMAAAVSMGLFLGLPILLIGHLLLWNTLLEIQDATHLKERIKMLERA